MARVIEGTKSLKGVQMIKGTGDVRKIRCKKCNGLTAQMPDGKGGTRTQCPQCGTVVLLTRI